MLKYLLVLLFLMMQSFVFAGGVFNTNGATVAPDGSITMAAQGTDQCNCWLPRDASFQIVPMQGGTPPQYRNDDSFSNLINLPFTLCFYGQSVNSVYINNNGNVSINAPYFTFSADPFPSADFVMIAPFWGDVDTRNPQSGLVYYQLAPTHLVVQWEEVGYFNSEADKKNTFQLILTDGNDTLLPPGMNVSFCYKDMQWTTGAASQGVNGFGGIPATVGVNRGAAGNSYIQFGRFDRPGGTYNGPSANNSGIDWLDNKSFIFSFCTSDQNVAPVLASTNICDTIRFCQGAITDTTIVVAYLPPEPSQQSTISINPNGNAGVSVLSNTPGPYSQMTVALDLVAMGPGMHTITVSATDNGTPAITTQNNVVIDIAPQAFAGFTFTPNNPITVNTPVAFNNISTQATSYVWDFGDGSPVDNSTNPIHTYTSPGAYDVMLVAKNGICPDTIYQRVNVVLCATSSFVVSNSCAGDPTTITYTGNSTQNAIFTWDFGTDATVLSGSGRGPYTLSWPSQGIYNVSLVVQDTGGCFSPSTIIPVIVNPYPTVGIAAQQSACAGDQVFVQFNGTAGGNASYSWTFGSGSSSGNTGPGPFAVQWNSMVYDQISVTVNDQGCISTGNTAININQIPTADFVTIPAACANDQVSINYIGNASPFATYTWDFNSGQITFGSGQGPYSIFYSTGGTYNVTLTVEENGCTSTPLSQQIAITDFPLPTIAATTGICPNDLSNITYTGTALPNATYNWFFTGGTVASGSGNGPYQVSWPVGGQYNVSVTVAQNGCQATGSFPVNVFPTPTADFAITPSACLNDQLVVNYIGSASAGATYNWDFGTATVISGSGRGPYNVSYSTIGTQPLSLNVIDNGCPSLPYSTNTIINPPPQINAGADTLVCSGTLLTLGSAPLEPNVIYSWTPAATLSNPASSAPQFTTENNGNVTITNRFILNATSVNGCPASDTVFIRSYPLPRVSIPVLPPQCLATNNFNFTGITNVSGVNFYWTFPDGNPSSSTQSSQSVTYSAVGTYPVYLSADYFGCPAAPVQSTVKVNEMPTADFEPLVTEGCMPLTVPFRNLSAGNGISSSWNFYDGTPFNYSENPIHTFTQAGIYTVTVSATNIFGCTATKTYTDTINVYQKPEARFVSNPQVADAIAPVFQFLNYSSQNSITYEWFFGDSTTSTEREPEHTYAGEGTYEVTLVVTSGDGCVDTVRSTVRVEERFAFFIPNSFSPNGDGINDSFRGLGINFEKYQMKIFNRWGKEIFSTDDYEKPWDGKINEVVQNDVYVYRILIKDNEGVEHRYIGNLSVVK